VRDSPTGGLGTWSRNVPYVDQNLMVEPWPSPLTAWINQDPETRQQTEHWVYAKDYGNGSFWWTEFFYADVPQTVQLVTVGPSGTFPTPTALGTYPSVAGYAQFSGYQHIAVAQFIDLFTANVMELYFTPSDSSSWNANQNIQGGDSTRMAG
jgi:hypothetical protein